MTGAAVRSVLADGLLVLGFAGCCYLALAAVLVRRFARRAPAPAASPEAVTILKPLRGAEPGLFGRLATFCRQDYPGPTQIIFGVADARDPAAEIVRELQRCLPEADIELLIDPRRHGSNRKVSNLANMAGRARHRILVLADSDIEVRPDYLRCIVAELAQPNVGVVTCLYCAAPEPGRWNAMAGLQVDGHFLPNAILGLTIGLARPGFGSTIALSRETLESVGGFARVADKLADDNALCAAVRATGKAVVVPPLLVAHAACETSARDLVRHELRWARTIRGVDPLGYAGTVVTHPLPLALLAGLFGSGPWMALSGLAVLSRFLLVWVIERSFGTPRHRYWLLPVRDLLSFAIYLWSYFGSAVVWRGDGYRLEAEGRLVEDRRGRAE